METYFKKNIIALFFLSTLFYGCQKNNSIKYSFFVAGHTYGSTNDKAPGLHPPFKKEFEKINNDHKIELGFFTGDIVRFPEEKYWEATLADISQLNCETHIAPGNHEIFHKYNFEKYLNKYYYAFEKNNDLFIILNGNENNWNIEGDQLLFFEKTINEKAADAGHIFIFIHQLIWWKENTVFGSCQPNSLMHKSDSLNFHKKIVPFLETIPKPIYLFAGDVGAYEDRCSVFHHKINNITLLASGMGNYKTDNYLKVDILNNGKVEINIIGLNCKKGFDCSGNITDYLMLRKKCGAACFHI